MYSTFLSAIDIGAISALDALVPLAAAGIGATAVAAVSRHLRRQELYVQAAQKINDYMDEASESLNQIDIAKEFDHDRVGVAKRAVNLARFHSRRLESMNVSGRLDVADFVFWDMLDNEDYRGRFWAYRAIDDVMNAVVEFMILPRMWPPRWRSRHLPENRLPNRSKVYLEITKPDPESGKVNWAALRKWVRQREKELNGEIRRRTSP